MILLTLMLQRDRIVARQHRENMERAAEAAAASEENRMKSEFLANMSHELRTPLNAILGFSDSMRNEIFAPLGGDRYRVYLNDIWDSGQHLLGIVDDVLDMTKIEVGTRELEPVELHGGTLKIASVPGEGTKVLILFPPERVKTEHEKAAAPQNAEAAA